jgi:hypothetical protein
MYVCMYKYIYTYMYLCMDGWMYSMYVSTYVHVYYIKRGLRFSFSSDAAVAALQLHLSCSCSSVASVELQLLQLCSSVAAPSLTSGSISFRFFFKFSMRSLALRVGMLLTKPLCC